MAGSITHVDLLEIVQWGIVIGAGLFAAFWFFGWIALVAWTAFETLRRSPR